MPAAVAPVIAFVGSIGTSIAAATGLSLATVGAIARIGLGLLINAYLARRARSQIPQQQDIRQRLGGYSELIPRRFVYGRCFATGTPIPGTTKEGFQYTAFLLNSRPSEGNFELYLDNRPVTLEGNPYALTGAGGRGTNGKFDGHVRVWFSRGDQTQPPQHFLDDVPYDASERPFGYKASECGKGLTIVWLRLLRGSRDELQDRWPNYPRVEVSVLGDWSKVWDPRDPSQDPTNPATHTFSRNQALCLLDLLMRNPFRNFSADDMDLTLWEAGADVAEELVPLKNGTFEPRYNTAGTVVFDGTELEDLVEPLEQSGAGRIARMGGRIGYVPGVARTPSTILSDMEGLPSLSMVPAPEEVFDEVHTTYTPLERDGAPASLSRWQVPGVTPAGLPRVMQLDLTMVTSDTQAQRIQKIAGLATRFHRRMTGVAFADALDVMPGGWVTTALPFVQMNGVFEIETAHPLAYPVGEDGGVAMRVPLSLRERDASMFAWDPATDEQDVEHPIFEYGETALIGPGAISIETGATANLNTGGTILPRVKFLFDPAGGDVEEYEYQLAAQGTSYGDLFKIDKDTRDGTKVFGYITGAPGTLYDLRVRSRYLQGVSDWVEITGITPVVDIAIDPPGIGTPTESPAGTISIAVTVPNDPDARAVELYVGPDGYLANAAPLGALSYAAQNTTVTFVESGLGSGVTRVYFARARGDFSNASAFTAGRSITTA